MQAAPNRIKKINRNDLIKILFSIFIIIIVNATVLSTKIHGQELNLDSLQKQLSTITNDKDRVINLSTTGFVYIDINMDSAMSITNSALKLAYKINDSNGIASCFNTLGFAYFRQGDDKKGISYILNSIEIQKKLKNEIPLLQSIVNLSSIYINKGDYAEALSFLLNALPLAEKYESTNAASSLIYKNLGIVYREMKEYDQAIKYFKKAIDFNLKTKNYQLAAAIKVSLSILYAQTNNLKSAFIEVDEAISLSSKLNDLYGVGIATENKGDFYFKQKNYNKAMLCFSEAKAIYDKLGNKSDMAYIEMEIGKVYTAMENYEEAISHLDHSLHLAKEADSRNYIQDIYNQLSATYKQSGNYKLAFQYYKNATELKDSLKSESQLAKLSLLRTQFETEQKDKKISLLTAEKVVQNQKYRLGILSFSIIILSIGFLGLIIYNRNKLLKKQNIIAEQERQILEQQQVETEQRLLRTQMNPHFIFNCLNTIDSFVLQNKSKEASNLIQLFSKLSRKVLDFTSRPYISLQEEIELLSVLLQIEQMRLKDKFEFKINVEEEELLNALIPPMMIQPFVENAILHGIRPRKSAGGMITINLKKEGQDLKISIEDNGIGREMSKINKVGQTKTHISRSMDITQSRLASLHPNKSTEEYIHFTDFKGEKTGTKVDIYIPLVKNEENPS